MYKEPEDLKALISSWRWDPRKFAREALRIDARCAEMGKAISWQQEEAFEALRLLVTAKYKKDLGIKLTKEDLEYVDKIGLSIMSGKGTGKDAWLAWVILYFIFCFEDCKIPCTANTQRQLRTVLWGEVAFWLKGTPIENFIIWQSEKIYFKAGQGKTWYAIAITSNIKASAEEQSAALGGQHARYMMVVFDEASGLPESVLKPFETTLTNPLNFLICVFNPTRRTGWAVDTQDKTKDPRWVTLHWDSEESPLVDKTLIKSIIDKYGYESNMYRVNVKGLPPMMDPDCLIPYEWVIEAVERELPVHDDDQNYIGVDVGGGGDKSIILTRRNDTVVKIKEHHSPDTAELKDWIAFEIDMTQAVAAYIDVIGIGNNVYYELLRHPNKNISSAVFPVDVRFRAFNNERFKKRRDELWFNIRDRFEKGFISIPKDEELIGQLTTIKFKLIDGLVKVEGKDDLRRRGLPSPDKADALIMSYAMESGLQTIREERTNHRNYGRSHSATSWMGN